MNKHFRIIKYRAQYCSYRVSLAIILLALTSLKIPAQDKFENADNHARNYRNKSDDVKELTEGLLVPFTDDTLKARAIFTWISGNISPDTRGETDPFAGYAVKTNPVDKALEDAALKRILRKREGLSYDFSRLFAAMCETAGIRAVIVNGTARISPSMLGRTKFSANYYWNALQIGKQWYIYDAMMGSGTTDPEKQKFIKEFREEYFMMDPSVAVLTHFPASALEQFLKIPIPAEDLKNHPVRGYGWLKYGVKEFSPGEGLISSEGKKSLVFKFRFTGPGPENLYLIEGSKHTEIKSFKSDDGFVYFGYDLKGRNRIVTIAGKEAGKVLPILSFKII